MNIFSRNSHLKHKEIPLLNNGGSWNPALHPRDWSNGEFIDTDGGLHGRPPSQQDKAPGKSAIANALALAIDANTDLS